MSHLAWIALNAFRPKTGGAETIVEAAVAITTPRLELLFHEHAPILDPGANQVHTASLIPEDLLTQYEESGLWADLAANRISIASFDRHVAGKLAALDGIKDGSKLEVFGLARDRALIADQAPALSAMLQPDAYAVESFHAISRRFLIGGAVPTAHNSIRAYSRNQNNQYDLFRVITGNLHAKGLAA